MTHDFETRENTGWTICKRCGYVLPSSGVVAKEKCEVIDYGTDDE